MKPTATHGLDLSLCIKCRKGKVRRAPGPRGKLQVWCDICNREGRKRASEIDAAAYRARIAGVEYWWEQTEVYPKMRGRQGA